MTRSLWMCVVVLCLMACQEDDPVNNNNALGQTEADAGQGGEVDGGNVQADTEDGAEVDTGGGSTDTGAPQEDMGAVDTGVVAMDTNNNTMDMGEPDLPDDDPPRSGMAPMPRPYSGGSCPVITGGPTSGEAVNEGFITGDQERRFRFLVPDRYDGSEPWPVMFAWHWLNASSNSFVDQGELESAAEDLGFLVVLPDKLLQDNGDKAYLFDWPFAEDWGAEQELTFFDDLLSCVDQQYNVDLNRVYGIGVSAGALWLTYLSTTDRVDHMAAVVSLSGGLGDVFGAWRMEYTSQPHKFPALVLWGGPSDWLGLSFSEASMRYEQELIDDGHFVMRCIHDSGHAVPPIEPPDEDTTRFISLWQFMLDHPYGTPAGTSPYQETGLPSVMPEWCTIATP